MARKNDWCIVIDSSPGLLMTDWPLYGSLTGINLILPDRSLLEISAERYGNLLRVPNLIYLWTFYPKGNRFTGIPAGSVLTNRQETNGLKFVGKCIQNKLDTVIAQCANEYMFRRWWSVGSIHTKGCHLSCMESAFNNFHHDYEPLPEHPFVLVDYANHGAVTDLILDTTVGVYPWQRLDFYNHKGELCYSGYVKEIVGHTVTMTDCVHNDSNRNYHKMPNDPKHGSIGIEPHMNQLVLIDRYLKGEFNDYIRRVMTDHLVKTGYKLPKVHVT